MPPDSKTLPDRQQAFGYTHEDLKFFLEPIALSGQEPVGAMGRDIPQAVLSRRPKLLFDYCKQNFAQVCPKSNLIAPLVRSGSSRHSSRSTVSTGDPAGWRTAPMSFSDLPRLWTFKEMDTWHQRPKGTAFRVFKQLEGCLREGEHYHYLDAQSHDAEIAQLRQGGRIYASSVNVVLLTEAGYRLLEQEL